MKNNTKILIKILVSMLILFVILVNINQTKAATKLRAREEITDKLSDYPGYTELINKLKEAHPEWNFRILYTGLDWNDVIRNEATHGRNLVSSSRASSWICSTCGDKAYDNGSWRCASEAAISYYMDPRNSLNETYVFQFEALSYNKDVQTIEGVMKIISDVGYMQGDTIKYTKTDGTQGVIEKSYAQVIMEAAEEANVSPYHLAARIRQEQGTGNSPSVLANGKYSGYIGYYNFFNIRASGNGSAQIIANGLTYAKNNGWTDPELAIKGGAKFLAKNYISDGQDTLYLQKFDVDDSDGALYYFQYMQNLSASKSEGVKAKESYTSLGLLDSKIDFIIPVFENMPANPCPEPANAYIVTQNVQVTGSYVNIRKSNTTNSDVLLRANKGYKMIRIEISAKQNEGYYWDKVVLQDGRIGYVARNYIEQIADIKSCDEVVIVNTDSVVRNGPGLDGTTPISNVVNGQILNRIENGKYTLNDEKWDRVVFQDGRQGYIEQSKVNLPKDYNTDKTEITNDILRVICSSGLKVRETEGTQNNVISYAETNSILIRLERGIEPVDGFVWDKVATSNGIVGYVARGDSKENYIEVLSAWGVAIPKKEDNNNNNNSGNETSQGENNNNNNQDTTKTKIEDKYFICIPDVKIEDLKELYKGKTITVKKSDNKTKVTIGDLATGYVITIDKKTYTVVKLGDVNGDGKINSGDSLILSKQVLKKMEISNEFMKLAGDINRDGKINSGDTLIIQKLILNTYKLLIVDKKGE